VEQQRGVAPEAGARVSLIGLGVAVLGGIVYATGIIDSSGPSQHGAAATPLETREAWPTPHRDDPDF
jgi:hypothetical protein